MHACELDYHLPHDCIAQTPTARRGESRLLVVRRAGGGWTDRRFADLLELVGPNDLVVLNNTRVLPARFWLLRSTGGRIEGLWTASRLDGTWEVLLRGAGRLRRGEILSFEGGGARTAQVIQVCGRGRYVLAIHPPDPAEIVLAEVGLVPLPHYIKRPDGHPGADDRTRYQTVYASQPGAVAAPTAGLHFDESMLARLRAAGIRFVEVTLHVGPGTFTPIEADDLDDHVMHAEHYRVAPGEWAAIDSARRGGGRVVAVGTTSVRAVESIARSGSLEGTTDLFIRPPYDFDVVGALLTNFHLPRSTLLAMVYAFGGTQLMRAAYEHAIGAGYRFYSYGDAMLIE